MLKIGERETAFPMGKRPKKSRLTRKTSGKNVLPFAKIGERETALPMGKRPKKSRLTRKNAGRIIPLRPRKNSPGGEARRLFFAGAMP